MRPQCARQQVLPNGRAMQLPRAGCACDCRTCQTPDRQFGKACSTLERTSEKLFFKNHAKHLAVSEIVRTFASLLRTTRALSSAGSERLPYKQRVGGSNPSAPTTPPEGLSFTTDPRFFLCPCGGRLHFYLKSSESAVAASTLSASHALYFGLLIVHLRVEYKPTFSTLT